MMKMFLDYVAQKAIPPAATEVFGDMATRYYEGCIILRILDHRELTNGAADGTVTEPEEKAEGNSVKTEEDATNASTNSAVNQPKTHNTVLRPTPLSMWHDLLYTTDGTHGWFSDQLALQIEAELLKFSVRNIDLRVPENPYNRPPGNVDVLTGQAKRPEPGSLTLKAANKTLFTHRPEVPRKRRRLHEDMLHHGSEYEQLMLIMDEKPAQPSGQFMRLSFIETWRKKQQRAKMNAIQHQMLQQQQQTQQQQQPLDGQQKQQQIQNISMQSPQLSNAQASPQQTSSLGQMASQQQQFNRQQQQMFGSSQGNDMLSNAGASNDIQYNNNNNTSMGNALNASTPASSSPTASTPAALSSVSTPGPSSTPKTRGGKGSRPRGKTGTGRGGGSGRGRGKAGSKASGGDNYMSNGMASGMTAGKTVPGASAGKTLPGSTGGILAGSPLYGAASSNSGMQLSQNWGSANGMAMGGSGGGSKTVPGKKVPGKTVPGGGTGAPKGRPKLKKESKR